MYPREHTEAGDAFCISYSFFFLFLNPNPFGRCYSTNHWPLRQPTLKAFFFPHCNKDTEPSR